MAAVASAVVSAFPRASLDALDPRVQALVRPIAERVGYVGDFFAVVGRNPEALLGFMHYTNAVKAGLAERLNEVIALTVCGRLGADYERIQHERLCEHLGFDRAWIAALIGHPDGRDAVLAADESLLVDLANALLEAPESGRARGLIEAACASLGDLPALAAVLQVARFQMIATIVRAFGLELPVLSALSGSAPRVAGP